jgi:putative transposase
MPYHLLNRRVMRMELFGKPADYEAFEGILAASLKRPDAPRLLAWCLMPNHWHLVVLPKASSNLSTWMQWLTVTHTHRWHQHYGCAGEGPLYQGRFKSFPIQKDLHLLRVMRYVEANARRAELVTKAEAWRWGSLWVRLRGSAEQRAMLSDPPVELPENWPALVNARQAKEELEQVRRCVMRGAPLGDERWVRRTVWRLGLEATQRGRGRPRKERRRAALAGKSS